MVMVIAGENQPSDITCLRYHSSGRGSKTPAGTVMPEFTLMSKSFVYRLFASPFPVYKVCTKYRPTGLQMLILRSKVFSNNLNSARDSNQL